MQTVRQKWQLYKTYQRLQRLWEEYLLASSQEESPAMTVQLNEFLTAFEEAYAEWTQVSLSTHISATLDKLYGDCSEILVNLLYTIERVVNQHKPKTAMSDTNNCCDDELIGKALNEEKYRRVVLDTPNLTTRILALLNKLKSTTTRRYAIRVLLALSQEDDAKLEIGRHQGFRKILLLVSQNDDTLTAEVIHTIKRLAETQNEVRVSTTIAEEIDDSLPTHFSALIGVAVGDKVTSLVSDVRDIMSFELGRVFPHLGSPGNSTRGRVDYFHNNPTTTDHKCDFVPNAATIEHWLDSLQIDPNEPLHLSRMNSHGNNNSSSSSNTAHVTTNSISTENQTIFGRWRNLVGLGKQRPAEMEAAHTERRESEESSNRIAMDQVNEPTKNAKVIRDLLRQQNALRSLTKILQSRNNLSSASRLELVEIICKLLFNHPTSQLLFHQIDGYSAILEDLNRPWKADKAYRYDNDLPTSYGVEEEDDDNDENEEGEEEEEEEEEDDNGDEDTVKEGSDEDKEELWYRDYFNLLFTIALGLTPDLKITHIEAADLLFRIATEATQLKARRHALYCIQDLITVNPFNAVVGWKCGGVDRLIRMLTTSASTQGNDIVLAKQMGLDPESQYTGSDHGSIVDIERATALEKIVDASLLWQYIASITWLLEYFSEYTRILMQITLPSYNVVVGMILRSVGRLLTDQLCRQNAVEPRFLNIYLQLLRRAYHLKDSVSDTDENPNVAELLEHSMLINPHDMQTIESTRRAMVQEQYLALLQIIGMLIEATGRDMELVKVNQGFQILHDAVALSTTLCWKIPQNNDSNAPFELDYDHEYERLVCDMAMWLLRECLLCKNATSDGIKWLVKLLKLVLASLTSTLKTTWIIDENDTGHEEDSMTAPHTKKAVRPFRFSFSWFHVKICQLLSSVFRRSNLAKRHFGELGGIEALLTVLSQTRDLNVATCALIAVGDLFAGGEETKQLLGETFGYEGFMELVLSSQRPLDRLCCQILLEVATVGSVVRDLSKVDRDEEPFHLSGAVIPFIAGLLVPTVLFEGPLPFYEGRKPGLQTPSLERPVSNSRPGSQRPAQSASRPSSIFSDGNRRHRDTSSSIGD
ncbi:hypothetical protein BDF19DRAFT_421513 [Syncephalis fuscata]|nr:hypothetical protein BDF19DRAFT_421513 [Syncephalis fuscata]